MVAENNTIQAKQNNKTIITRPRYVLVKQSSQVGGLRERLVLEKTYRGSPNLPNGGMVLWVVVLWQEVRRQAIFWDGGIQGMIPAISEGLFRRRPPRQC